MSKLTPPANTKVLFAAATAYAERINVKKKKIQVTRAHRGEMATLDNGWLVIDRRWYSGF